MNWWVLKQLRAQVLSDLREFVPEGYFAQEADHFTLNSGIKGSKHFSRELTWGELASKLGKTLFYELQAPRKTARQDAASELLMHLGLLACTEASHGLLLNLVEFADERTTSASNAKDRAAQLENEQLPHCRSNLCDSLKRYLDHLTPPEAKPYTSLLEASIENAKVITKQFATEMPRTGAPTEIQNVVENSPPALPDTSQMDWWDASLEAGYWWGRTDITPVEATILMTGRNPNSETAESAARSTMECIQPSHSSAGPDKKLFDGRIDEFESLRAQFLTLHPRCIGPEDYTRILGEFESTYRTLPAHRTLDDWHEIAHQRRLKHHVWVDEYAKKIIRSNTALIEPRTSPIPNPFLPETPTKPKVQKEDALAMELNDILMAKLVAKEKIAAGRVMAELKKRAGRKDSCILSVTAGGVKWERSGGEQEELTAKMLDERIRRWRKKNTPNPRLAR